MKLQYNVNIQKNVVPIFPKTCLVCGASTNEQCLISGNPKVSYFGGWQWIAKQSAKVIVYGHDKCIRRLNLSLSVRTYVLFLAIGLFIPLKFMELNPYIFTPIILSIISSVLFWMIKFPVSFEVTEIDDLLNFEFKNKKIAAEFARLNNAKVY